MNRLLITLSEQKKIKKLNNMLLIQKKVAFLHPILKINKSFYANKNQITTSW